MCFLLRFRFGPRQIRVESALLRAYNSGTRAAPYESLMVADIGDVNVNVYDLKDTCKRIREAYRKILAAGCIPLTMGERVAGAESPCLHNLVAFHKERQDVSVFYNSQSKLCTVCTATTI